jgi:hypothetical protein
MGGTLHRITGDRYAAARNFDTGAHCIAGNLISQPITRSHYRRWSATDDEIQCTLPGTSACPRTSSRPWPLPSTRWRVMCGRG